MHEFGFEMNFRFYFYQMSNGRSRLVETRSLCRWGYISQFKTRAICSTNIAGSNGLVSTAATPS